MTATITNARLKTLRDEMNAALANAGITDFEFEVGNMRYTSTEVTIKVTAKLQGEGVVATSDAIFERKVAELGLKMVGDKGKRLTGYSPSRWKFPFSYETVRGARYKCTEEQAKVIFG